MLQTKTLLTLFTAFVMLFALGNFAEANYLNNFYGSNNQGNNNNQGSNQGYQGYGNSGYQPYGNYGYNSPQSSSSNIFVNDNFNKYSNSYDNSGFKKNAFTGSQSANNNDFFAQAFFNKNYGNFNQNGVINLNDGYSFTKDACVTKKINANFKGKSSDFVIKETVCDGIAGNFFKDNQYKNNINNNFGYNQANVGANVVQNNFNQNLNQNNVNQNTYSNKGYALGQSTSFGKGTQLIFY